MARGMVYLVGAGPGDPGLLTCRGKAILETCEVVVYDRLANPKLLELAPPTAARIFVGKAPGRVAMDQDGINACLVEHGLAGRRVCRLKGGDPFVFGRGGEEALACLAAGVPFEVVPGVTSAIGAPAYAGIPVTHRDVATSFAVITGHENPDKPATQVDWAGIARGAATLCFLMGLGNLPEIVGQLIRHGRAPSTPVACVRWGTWPRQEVVVGTLETIVAEVERAGLRPPAVTIVSETVNLRQRLRWFDNRPLHGRTVVVTRSRTQSSELADRLTELGAEVLEFPVIAIEPVAVGERVGQLVAEGLAHDWLIFTSTNAVERFFAELDAVGGDARCLGGCDLAAIGPATAAALARHGLRADFIPSNFNSDDFAAEFGPVEGRRVLIPCGRQATGTIAASLRERGAEVEVLEVYDTVLDESAAAPLAERLAAGEIDAVTFTSSSTARNFRTLLPDVELGPVKLLSIGPKTSATLRELGLAVAAEAAESTLDGLVEAVLAIVGS